MNATLRHASLALALGLVAGACTEPAPELDPVAPTASAKTACTPRPAIDPALCNANEPPPPQSRPGGSCTFEISLTSIENTNGQGATEGTMEVSVVTTANGDSLDWPSSGTRDIAAGTDVNVSGGMITTVSVAAGQQRNVPLCATITEHDDGGINGGDDTGQACTSVTLIAQARPNGRVVCQVSDSTPDATTQLCVDNQCNGWFDAHWEVLVADVDQDCVPNEDDFTPEPCDEAEKGKLGRASLIWFHMGDGPMTTFYQAAGTDLTKATTGYDYVVAVMDTTSAGPFLINAQALQNGVDKVFTPYEAELYEAMRDITRRGYDMDVWVFAHGSELVHVNPTETHEHTHFTSMDTGECSNIPGGELCGNGVDDDGDQAVDEADCAALPAGELCWNGGDDDGDGIADENDGVYDHELIANLAPERIGTTLVPIRMAYSIACFNEGMNHAWMDVGAKVASGTIGINFFPVFFGGFADAWNASASYDSAVVQSDKPGDRFWVYTWIEAQGVTFDCDDDVPGLEELLPVLGLNPCAEDYFVDTGENDDAIYNIGADAYDPTESGETNVNRQSVRVTTGDGTIKKFSPPTLTW